MSFNPKGKAQIESITINRGQSDEANVSVVINLSTEGQSVAVARAVLGADSDDEVRQAFFRPVSQDADQNPRFLGLKAVETNARWEGRHAIKLAKTRQMRVAALGKIALTPRGHASFDIDFQVRIEDPPQGFLDTIGSKLHSLVDFELEHDAELPLDQPAGGQSGAPPEPKARRAFVKRPKAGKAAKAARNGASMGTRPRRAKKAAKAS